MNIGAQAIAREKEALSSIRFFFKGDSELETALALRLKGLAEAAGMLSRDLENLYAARCRKLKAEPVVSSPDRDEARLAGLVPFRTKTMGGIMDMWKLRGKAEGLKYRPTPEIAQAEFELGNFIDGRRTILDIRNAASAEYGPLPLAGVEAYLRFLEKLGMIEIKKK